MGLNMHSISLMFIFFLFLSAEATNQTGACNDGKIRGVNAGGWLLLEPWVTPKFFESLDANDGNQQRIVDEYTMAQYVSPDDYREKMKNHWDTFITLADFQRVAQAGVSHIRVPVGYWYWDV